MGKFRQIFTQLSAQDTSIFLFLDDNEFLTKPFNQSCYLHWFYQDLLQDCYLSIDIIKVWFFLRRRFAWSVKSYFLRKIRKIFQNVICWNFYPRCKVLMLCSVIYLMIYIQAHYQELCCIISTKICTPLVFTKIFILKFEKIPLTLKLPVTTVVICFVISLWFLKSFLQTVWTQIRLLL